MIEQPVIDAAQAAHAKWGVWASVTLAQFGIESAWGRFEPPGSNNPFGIKALSGLPTVPASTHEYVNGRMISVVARFAAFPDLATAFDEHAKLLATSRYYTRAMAATSADEFAYALTGVYATAPNYGGDLVALMKADDLYQYDAAQALPTPVSPRAGPIATVAQLQAALNRLRAVPLLLVDNRFGTRTRAALIAFQTRAGLAPDGIFGPQTEAAMGVALASLSG